MFASRSKKTLALLALLSIGAVALGGCSATPVAHAAAATTTVQAAATAAPASTAVVDPARTITVVGHGEVKGQADVARSNIGIEVMAPTVAEATRQANANMDAVIKALKAAGVADKDIQTSNFSINFERQGQAAAPADGTSVATGVERPAGVYRVNNMVNVTIRDLTKVAAVIDAAVGAGANNIYGINFGLDDTSTQEAQAREKAVADARGRALNLARLNDVTLGGVVAVSEVIGSPVTAKYALAQGMGGGGTPVEPGEVTFSTDIQIVYAIQ